MEDYRPLVSVNVLMYNSSRYIIETLESIKAQTYQNIELIMSDDKSTDNTVQICEDWISRNKYRFVSYKILVPEHNTGQSGNYNRAFNAGTGEWVKEIDGDDLLMPDCIQDFVDYVQSNPESKYIFGKVQLIGDKDTLQLYHNPFDYTFFSLSPHRQLQILLSDNNCIPSPGAFYNRRLIKEIGFECDERIPLLEDWPKWINLLNKGVAFSFLDKDVAFYRVGNGISTSAMSTNYYGSYTLFVLLYKVPYWNQMNDTRAIVGYVEGLKQIYDRKNSLEKKVNSIRSTFLMKSILWFKNRLNYLCH